MYLLLFFTSERPDFDELEIEQGSPLYSLSSELQPQATPTS